MNTTKNDLEPFYLRHDLRDQILAFIAYDNRTMAKPIKWTYTGLI